MTDGEIEIFNPETCALVGCFNKKAKSGRWCDTHRKPQKRPDPAPVKPGHEARVMHPAMVAGQKKLGDKNPGVKAWNEQVVSIRALAREASPHALKRLVQLVNTGSGAVQVQAAKAVLGIAGVHLVPTHSVKHQHEVLQPQASLSVKELLELVRPSPGPYSMPLSPKPLNFSTPAPSGSYPIGAPMIEGHPSGASRSGPDSAINAQYREITSDSTDSAVRHSEETPSSSGDEPNVPKPGEES